MRVDGVAYRSIWREPGGGVRVIDQRCLPHSFRVAELATLDDAAAAIREMWVRGAPLIGATAAYGVALAMAGCLSRCRRGRRPRRVHTVCRGASC